jgi:hypothetical protein
MSGLFSRFDWRKSWPHREMLSRFVHPREYDYFLNDWWPQVLNEAPEKALKRFQSEGLIEPSDSRAMLDYKFKATELKDLLRQRGLKVSGKKPELADRLAQADPEGVADLTRGLALFQCTPRGYSLAQDHLAREDEMKTAVDHEAFEALQDGDFTKASETISEFQAARYEGEHDIPEDAEMLKVMFETTPQILTGMPQEVLSSLRLAAGMAYLWGATTARKWVSAEMETGTAMNGETAARMIYFNALSQQRLREYRESGIAEVEILGSGDSCDACREIAGKRFRIEKAPILPYGKCTHEMGCRCDILPLV